MTGCDTVLYPYGTGNISALKLLEGCSLPGFNTALGDKNVPENNLKEIGSSFSLALYGQEKKTTLYERFVIWARVCRCTFSIFVNFYETLIWRLHTHNHIESYRLDQHITNRITFMHFYSFK